LRRALDELRASHQRLKAAQLQLIQSEKLECIGTLAAGVAHEVKNPLQTILMGVAYLAKNLPAVDDPLLMVLSDMREAVKRADAIVRDLLYLSVSRQIEMKEENLNAVLTHSLSFVNFDLARSRVQVRRELAPALPPIRLDKQKLEQVFINLFMNAIHAMPHGGELLLRTSGRIWPADGIDTSSKFQPGDAVVCVEVEDSGVGIPDDKLELIFKPFFTTKPNGLGTGLGLPVSKQIIDLHGGLIYLGRSSLGGARATIVLKAEQENSHEKETDTVNR
jgi:signal transduction histidine kinase